MNDSFTNRLWHPIPLVGSLMVTANIRSNFLVLKSWLRILIYSTEWKIFQCLKVWFQVRKHGCFLQTYWFLWSWHECTRQQIQESRSFSTKEKWSQIVVWSLFIRHKNLNRSHIVMKFSWNLQALAWGSMSCCKIFKGNLKNYQI